MESSGPSELDDERDLVDRAHRGDRRALGQLLSVHGPRLYRSVLLPRLGSSAAAEEALGLTFMKAVEHFEAFSWQQVGVYPWLRTIAVRVALDQLRKRKRETLFDPTTLERELLTNTQPHEDPELLEQRDLAAARQRVTHLIERLNPRYRQAIQLRVLDGRSREAAAAELGIKVGTFDVVLHRAMTALKNVIATDGGAP